MTSRIFFAAAGLALLLAACGPGGGEDDGAPGPLLAYSPVPPAACTPEQLHVLAPGDDEPAAIGTAAAFVALRWSPDGESIAALVSGACEQQDRLVLLDVASGEETLVPLPPLEAPEGYSALLWSPDSTRVAIYGHDLAIASREGALLLEHGPTSAQAGLDPRHWAADSSNLAVRDEDGMLQIISRDGPTLSTTPVSGSGLGLANLVGWDGDAVFLLGQERSSGALRSVPLQGASSPAPSWGPPEDPEAPGRLDWYAAIIDPGYRDLRARIRESEPEAVFFLASNGLASDRSAIWDVYRSEPGETAVKVAVLAPDGTFQILVLPGVEVGRAELPPLLDVIYR